MSIENKLSEVLSCKGELSDIFKEQLRYNEEFVRRMKEGGFVPEKQEYSIPLIERIGTLAFSK